ncbi:unnamed protein product [Allacma fusca]|uniref:Uncharacterized protein n=1 Tax=Allacma fusca TaxID=39272 RepID=A0A8J2KWC3_9HEXA|nr:unnamed protein product [Allacma fusca]
MFCILQDFIYYVKTSANNITTSHEAKTKAAQQNSLQDNNFLRYNFERYILKIPRSLMFCLIAEIKLIVRLNTELIIWK